jgi:hypothetical protein
MDRRYFTFDRVSKARRRLPVWIERVNTPNRIACLRFDNGQARGLSRRRLKLPPVDQDSSCPAAPPLCVL